MMPSMRRLGRPILLRPAKTNRRQTKPQARRPAKRQVRRPVTPATCLCGLPCCLSAAVQPSAQRLSSERKSITDNRTEPHAAAIGNGGRRSLFADRTILQLFPQLIGRLQSRVSGDLPRRPDARHQDPAAVLEVEEVQDELVLAEDGVEQGGQGGAAYQEQG